jgi:hypothetical protein
MSEENLYKQKFDVEQWPTTKVTLYPTRASVVRQIEGVKLKVRTFEVRGQHMVAKSSYRPA